MRRRGDLLWPGRRSVTFVEHLAQGKRAVFVRNERVVLANGANETEIASLKGIPLTNGGRTDYQIENVLAASGAAWALGIGPEIIRTGLQTFTIA